MLSILLACLAQTTSAAPETPPLDLQVKASFGFPAIATGALFGGQGSALVGAGQSPWLFGFQGMGFTELISFSSPATTIAAAHALATRDIVNNKSWRISLLGGAGMAFSTGRGELVGNSSWLGAEYEAKDEYGPSLLLGVNVGKSWFHRIGLSLTVASAINQKPTKFASFQLDVGEWD